MVKLYIYEHEIENDFEDMVYKFLYSKQITDGMYAISFPHEKLSINDLINFVTVPYFESYYSITPDYKFEYFYIILNNEQTKKLMNKYYL
jgi:hypothetical protein